MPTSHSNRQLFNHSITAISLALVSSSAVSQVYYNDLDPDAYIGDWDEVFLDLDDDGAVDFTIHQYSDSTSWGFGAEEIACHGLGVGEVGLPIWSTPPAPNNWPVKLSFGDPITKDLFSWGDSPYGAVYYNLLARDNDGFYGHWDTPTEGYLAIRTPADSGYHYGWVRLRVDNTGNAVVFDHALNLQPNEGIYAGDTALCKPPVAVGFPISPALAAFSWSTVSSDGYQFRINEMGTSTIFYETLTATTLNRSVIAGKTYRWQVRSWCDGGFTTFSAVQVFTVPSSPARPATNSKAQHKRVHNLTE